MARWTALLSSLVMMLGTPAMAGAEGLLSLSLKLGPVASIALEDGSNQVAFEVSTDCDGDVPLCIIGDAPIAFVMSGNTVIDVVLRPNAETALSGRRLGQFAPVGDAALAEDSPPLLFDLVFDFEGRDMVGITSPLSEDDVMASSADWVRTVDLSKGPKRGRVWVRPVFDLSNPDIFASPGTYVAAIDLSISTH